MKCNVGTLDRKIRIVAGLVVIGAGIIGHNWWGALGVPLVASGILRICFLYNLLGISTEEK